jgi:hypothetical protein
MVVRGGEEDNGVTVWPTEVAAPELEVHWIIDREATAELVGTGA